jgi:hypothetical protein
MNAHMQRHRKLNLALMICVLWCIAVWLGVLHLLGVTF